VSGGLMNDRAVEPIEPLPLRLKPGDDLREALERFVRDRRREAAFVLAGIGSLERTMLRLAGADEAMRIDGDVEILSLSGSVGPSGSHLHISVADATGVVRGGHAAHGCIVRTTAEVLVALLPGWRFARERDPTTGFDELVAGPSGRP
jgi:uncharacterized protein